MLVLNKSKHTLIRRAPFLYDEQVTLEYDDDSNQYATVLSKDHEKVAMVWVCAPQSRKDKEAKAETKGKE